MNDKPSRMDYRQHQAARRLVHECCNYDEGNCLLLDDGEPCVCVQSISYSLMCRWFRVAVLPLDGELAAALLYRGSRKRCAVCGAAFVPKSNRGKYCPEDVYKRQPQHFAVRQYKKYKLASGKTAKSILISCGARLAPFDIPQLREIMSYDELELDRLGDEKSALFFLISDTDTTYNFLVAVSYTHLNLVHFWMLLSPCF